MRGNLILIEGLDRSGKSTQAEILASKLNAALFKFPDRTTPIGAVIQEYLVNPSFQLSDESIHLLFSANRWELAARIEQLLISGTNIVMDRYVYSGIAYSLAKENSRGQEWLYNPDKGLPKPDLTLFLSMTMDELAARKNWGDERYEKVAFQEKVKQCFLDVMQPDNDPSVVVVQVDSLSIEQVSERLWEIISGRRLHVASSLDLRKFE